MLYLQDFSFPHGQKETEYIVAFGGSSYPYRVVSSLRLSRLAFEPITIVYGNNGSGKSTVLNVIAEAAQIQRDSLFNKSSVYSDYVHLCEMTVVHDLPRSSRIITSDDVFEYILEIRRLNEGIAARREQVSHAYRDAKYASFQLQSIADYEELKTVIKARRKTQTQFIKSEVIDTVSEYSNGENAFRYFMEKIQAPGLYLLDEPENSLSPRRQLELKQWIEEAVRFFGCQFIISTHSPFLLALHRARIYDLDASPAAIKPWTALQDMRMYREFFKARDHEFEVHDETALRDTP